jgi:hypothetical protein
VEYVDDPNRTDFFLEDDDVPPVAAALIVVADLGISMRGRAGGDLAEAAAQAL